MEKIDGSRRVCHHTVGFRDSQPRFEDGEHHVRAAFAVVLRKSKVRDSNFELRSKYGSRFFYFVKILSRNYDLRVVI